MGGLCSPSLFIFAVTCCLLHMISRSRKASNSTHIYSSSAVSIRIITLGVCVWCFIKWGWDAEQHRPMLWFCCCFCMDAWFNQLHGPPPPTCCRLFICSNYSPNCSLDVFPVFIYNGGWQRWLWLGGEMHSCWSELLFAVHRLRANTYQFSKLHGTKPSKNERLHRCFEFKIPIET